MQDLREFIRPGDIVVFRSNRGPEVAHVALVLERFDGGEETEKLWVASHWSFP